MRSYQQFCALARALDVVGERWTLLLIRELLLGPRRYSDLLAGLPGIGTNLLAQRLRDLEGAGVVSKVETAWPARGHAYALTERGRALDATLLELAHWGMDDMAPPTPEDRRQPNWYALALRAAFNPAATPVTDESYQLVVDGSAFHFRVRGTTVEAIDGATPHAALVIRGDLDALLELTTGATERRELERAGRLTITGDRAAYRRWHNSFRLPTLQR